VYFDPCITRNRECVELSVSPDAVAMMNVACVECPQQGLYGDALVISHTALSACESDLHWYHLLS